MSAVFQSYRLAISPGTNGMNTFNLLQISVEAAISFYLVLLLPFYACVKTDCAHSQITYHLFTASSFSILHYYFATQGQALAIGFSLKPHWTSYYALGLVCLSTVASGSIPLGPGRFREQSQLYNKAVAERVAEIGKAVTANVLGSGRSILGGFMGFHVGDMARHVVTLEQVDLHELPVVTGAMQQQPAILSSVTWNKQSKRWLIPTLSLLWEVWGPQWVGWLGGEYRAWYTAESIALVCLTVEILISFVPWFCIQQILYTLDEHEDQQAAWAYASLWTLAQLGEIVAMVLRTWD